MVLPTINPFLSRLLSYPGRGADKLLELCENSLQKIGSSSGGAGTFSFSQHEITGGNSSFFGAHCFNSLIVRLRDTLEYSHLIFMIYTTDKAELQITTKS